MTAARLDDARVLRRYVPDVADAATTPSGHFSLTNSERALFGVDSDDSAVTLRASGLQWAQWTTLVVVSLVATAITIAAKGPALLSGCLMALTTFAVVSTALLRRQEVRLSGNGVSVRRRLCQARATSWSDAEFAVEVRQSRGVWLRGAERPTIACGVMRARDGNWSSIPGFRSPMWGVDKLDDPLTSTDLKIRLVLRCRAWLHANS